MGIRIVVTGINIVTLIVTLLVPSRCVAISLIPFIVAASTWLFTSGDIDNGKRKMLIAYTILTVMCLGIGFLAQVLPVCPNNEDGRYTVEFLKEVVFLSGVSFDYRIFVAFVFFLLTYLMIAELVSAHKRQRNNKSDEEPMDIIVRKAIKI